MLLIVLLIGVREGYKMKALSISGSIATIIIGIAIVFGCGIKGLILIAGFFITSSIWSKYKKDKKQITEEKNDKSSQRDAWQVLANGSVPATMSILYIFFQEDIMLFMFIAAIAAANSDTWASEIGPLSRRKPIHILTLKQVDAGTSGAVSLVGTVSAFLGAIFITIVSYFLWSEVSLKLAILLGLFGFLGNLLDTILGATVQATFYCSECQLVTEKRMHCNTYTTHKTGYLTFNNEMVNFISITLAPILVLIFY
ncbi:DUF92 domain-containing protein [Bacillus sp. Marseille-P3661]|uniref:DUF92 domain-containing protein n=1 Tax=Bacillus sp. Marseille-P3661 TaxID=1936234 RepID=UPI002155A85C|nr:DUF92 domain-containing protein [Bacillus sp. Marseille-P3661]